MNNPKPSVEGDHEPKSPGEQDAHMCTFMSQQYFCVFLSVGRTECLPLWKNILGIASANVSDTADASSAILFYLEFHRKYQQTARVIYLELPMGG